LYNQTKGAPKHEVYLLVTIWNLNEPWKKEMYKVTRTCTKKTCTVVEDVKHPEEICGCKCRVLHTTAQFVGVQDKTKFDFSCPALWVRF
jgi:hypothetical protein